MAFTRYIYGLTDDNGIVHYIGITTDMKSRLEQHLTAARYPDNYRKARRVSAWINSLGHAPGMVLIDVASPTESVTEGMRLERFHIRAHREAGFPLLNIHPIPRRREGAMVDTRRILWTCPMCGFCEYEK